MRTVEITIACTKGEPAETEGGWGGGGGRGGGERGGEREGTRTRTQKLYFTRIVV